MTQRKNRAQYEAEWAALDRTLGPAVADNPRRHSILLLAQAFIDQAKLMDMPNSVTATVLQNALSELGVSEEEQHECVDILLRAAEAKNSAG